MLRFIKFICLLFFVFTSFFTFSDEKRGEARERIEPNGFLYGFGLGVNKEIYQGYDRRVIPLPILGYRSENFQLLGPFMRADVFKVSSLEFTVQVAPRFQGFDESDSKIFKNMDERKFSMDAGLGVIYEKDNWKISVSSLFDVLNRSNGYEIKMKAGKVFRKGPIFIEPNIAVSYLDDKHVDYYYGVKAHEINENTYYYQGKEAINTQIGFSVSTPIFLGGFTSMSIDYTWFDDSITNSPLVDQNNNLSVRLLFSKFF